MTVINTNVSSLQAQNSLHLNQSKLTSAMERLSSGIRINSAKDDAAGLAITTRMTSEIRGLNQSVRNANDGISVAQTAEGSLGEITNILQRLRELSVQSSNSSNNATDRSFLNTEASQLIDEVERIGSQTNFNGIKLLNGEFKAQNFQVGANKGEVIVFNSIAKSTASGLGQHALGSLSGSGGGAGELGKVSSAAASGPVVNGVAGRVENEGFRINTIAGKSEIISYAAEASAKDIADAINEKGNAIGVIATATNKVKFGQVSANTNVTFTLKTDAGSQQVTAEVSDKNDLTGLLAAINGVSGITNVNASFEGSDKSEMTLKTVNGENLSIEDIAFTTTGASILFGNTLTGASATPETLDSTKASVMRTGEITLSSSQGQITTVNAEQNIFSADPAGNVSSSINSVSNINIADPAKAADALSVLDSALIQVNNTRAALGGLINRFEATISNQNTTIMNLSASRSRILDTDYAVETTNLAKAQIIQQAATAMLAQANQSSQSVLALLK